MNFFFYLFSPCLCNTFILHASYKHVKCYENDHDNYDKRKKNLEKKTPETNKNTVRKMKISVQQIERDLVD